MDQNIYETFIILTRHLNPPFQSRAIETLARILSLLTCIIVYPLLQTNDNYSNSESFLKKKMDSDLRLRSLCRILLQNSFRTFRLKHVLNNDPVVARFWDGSFLFHVIYRYWRIDGFPSWIHLVCHGAVVSV